MKKIFPIIGVVIVILILVSGYLLYNYTEIFGKKIIPIKISSVTLNYIPGANKNLVDSDKKNIVPVQEIKISSSELKVLKKKLKSLKKIDEKIKDNTYIATLIVNKDYKIYIGEKTGYIENKNDKSSIAIPNSLYNYVYDICSKNDSKIFKNVEISSISVSSNGAKISIQNKKNLDAINKYINYLDVNINDEYSTYNNGYKYTLTINDSQALLLYDNNVGYTNIDCSDGNVKYVVFKDNFYEVIDTIFKLSVNESKSN